MDILHGLHLAYGHYPCQQILLPMLAIPYTILLFLRCECPAHLLWQHLYHQRYGHSAFRPCALRRPALRVRLRRDAAQLQDREEALGVPMEQKPYYNDYALYVAMNQVASDHGKTIAFILGKDSVSEIETAELVKYAYKMAIDLLTDEDGMYIISELTF